MIEKSRRDSAFRRASYIWQELQESSSPSEIISVSYDRKNHVISFRKSSTVTSVSFIMSEFELLDMSERITVETIPQMILNKWKRQEYEHATASGPRILNGVSNSETDF
jgi:hypothetical protein